MPDASTLRSGSPPRGGSVLRTNLAISPERTMRIENGGPGGRRGNTEEQYGHVNWAATLRQKVWDDKLQRYIGVNPAAELGEDWRQPAKKRKPQDAMTLGTRTLSGGHKGTGVAASHMWESSQYQAANAENKPQPIRVSRPQSAFVNRSTMDPANPDWHSKHTIGRKRPSTAGRVSHISTEPQSRFDQWDLTNRPRTATTADSRSHFSKSTGTSRTRRTVSSSGSSASTMSFLDRFSTSDKKTQRLMMLQKKMDLTDAMTKKAQLSLGRPCTPEMVQALSSELGKEVEASVQPEALDTAWQQSVLEESDNELRPVGEEQIDHNLLNHEGGFTFGEVLGGTSELDPTVDKVTQRLGLTMESSAGFRSVNSAKDFDAASSRRSSSKGSRSSAASGRTNQSQDITMPWRGKGDKRIKSGTHRKRMTRQSGSLCLGMYDNIRHMTSRQQVTDALQQAKSVGPLDEGCCCFSDFETTLLQMSIRISRMEARWLGKNFPGHTPVPESFNYRLFLDSFWPLSEAHHEAVSETKRESATSALVQTLRGAILKYMEESGSGMPPAVSMLAKFQQCDSGRTGFVPAQAVADTLLQFEISEQHGILGENAMELLGLKFGDGGSSERINYSQLLRAILPPQLSMAEGPLSHTAGNDGVVGTATGGQGVARTFFDVVNKITQETHGNLDVLGQCFKLHDPQDTGLISAAAVQQALLLLRINLDLPAVETCFAKFTKEGMIDWRSLLREVFPAGYSMQASDAVMEQNVHDLEQEIYSRCKTQFPSLLVAFRTITNRDSSLSRKDLGIALRDRFNMNPDPKTLDALWLHWDSDGSDAIDFEEFAAIFSAKRGASNTIKSKNVKAVKQLVREAIEARLDGSGGGDLLKSFHFFDRDRSGSLTYDELTAGIQNYTGLDIDEGMLARLMDEYDPDGNRSIDFKDFARHVMGSDRGENMSFSNEHIAASATKAAATWTLSQLEAAIKKKMDKSWTQIISDMHTADVDNSGCLSRTELRGLLTKFCFELDDNLFGQLCDSFTSNEDGEIEIETFMRHFAKLDSMDGIQMSANMKLEDAQKFIAEKIEDKCEPGNGGLLRAYQLFDRDRSGTVDYEEFEHILQELAMVKLHPQLKKKLMKLYDPSGQGFIDFHAFTRFVMGSAPGAGTSYGNEEPTDPQRSDTLIHKRWEPEQVEACLRRRLRGERGARCVEALNSCDMERDGFVHVDEVRAILVAEKLDMTSAQWKELVSNFDVTPQHTIRRSDFVDAFVSGFEDEENRNGDPHWANKSIDEMKAVIRTRMYNRIGKGPGENQRTWKYFSRDKSSTLPLSTLREQLHHDLNLNLSEKLCEQLAQDYATGDDDEVDFTDFVQRVMGSSNTEAKSLVPISTMKDKVSNSGGNTEMFIKNKIRESFRAIVAAFRVADQDDTGSVRSKDLREILHRFAIDLTPQQFVELLNDLNADSDGTINYHTFIRHFQEKAAPSQLLQLHKYPVKVAVQMIIDKLSLKSAGNYGDKGNYGCSYNLRRAFAIADQDRSGTLSLDEMRHALTVASGLEPAPAQIIALLKHYGIDHSGEVDYQEFIRKMIRGGKSASTGLDTRRIESLKHRGDGGSSDTETDTERSVSSRPSSRPSSRLSSRPSSAATSVSPPAMDVDTLTDAVTDALVGEKHSYRRPSTAGSSRPGSAASSRSVASSRPSSRHSVRSSASSRRGKHLAGLSSKSQADLASKYDLGDVRKSVAAMTNLDPDVIRKSVLSDNA